MNPDVFRFALGDFSCMVLKDFSAQYPVGMFLTNIPREQYEPMLFQRGEDTQQVELPYTCLLVDTVRERVLVDTGIGTDGPESRRGRLMSLLQGEGIAASQIDTVILSHAHLDHIGGCLDDRGQPAFPNARYIMLRKEWDYWTSNPTLAELPIDDDFRRMMLASPQKNLPAIQKQLDLVNPGTEIVPGIVAVAAFGHTPGQMGLEITSAGQNLLFVADAIVLPLHLECPESIGVTDCRPDETVATRIQILEEATRHGSLVSISHFPFPGLGHIAANGTRWQWRALAASSEPAKLPVPK